MFQILKITGSSLTPEYQDGDYVLITTIPVFLRRLSVGRLIIFQHEIYGRMIKCISAVDYQNKKVFVQGTIIESLDSRQLGWIDFSSIKGKVIAHFPRTD
jgi:signal peptidase I